MMAAATSAPPLHSARNNNIHQDPPHNMAADTHPPGDNDLLDKMVDNTSTPEPEPEAEAEPECAAHNNYIIERPRASVDRSTDTVHTSNVAFPILPKKESRASLRQKAAKLAIDPPSQEDLHKHWASMQDESSAINTDSLKPQQNEFTSEEHMQRTSSSNSSDNVLLTPDIPPYTEPLPRPSTDLTIVRDFAYPASHLLHNGPLPDDDFHSDSPLSATAPHFTPGSSFDRPGPHRSSRDSNHHGRRASDSAESGTGNNSMDSTSNWGLGPWGGDGTMYEEMQPLPATSFSTTPDSHDDGIVWTADRTKKQNPHRKSKSYAENPSYERGRRRTENPASAVGGPGGISSKQQRGSYHGPPEYSAYSDPAGRERLRQSRGMVSTEHPSSSETSNPSDELDMYSLNPPTSPMMERSRPVRRDSHVANNIATLSSTGTVLPSRSYHHHGREEGGEGGEGYSPPETFISDLPLDHEGSSSSPPAAQRESLGPEDEELFAGPSVALYDFEAENANELGLREGELIMVSYRHGQGWLVAENEVGEQGLVPEAYVRLLAEMEEWGEEEEVEGG